MSSGTQEPDNAREILRLRDRVHRLESTAGALTWRLGLLDKTVTQLRGEVAELRETLEGMIHADELAQAVADKVQEEVQKRNNMLATWPRRIGALIAGALVLAESAKGLLGL